jgi:hypothetical protein
MKQLNIILISLILLTFNTVSFSQTNNTEQIDRKDVTEVLQQFQDGYTKRDTTIIDDFLKMFSNDIVFMGIASHEFFKGKESVKNLTLWDWKKWFDLKIPIEKIDIRIDNEVAWFEVVGESGPWRNGKVYEIRMVGSLIKSENKWLFKQICFSYPAPLKEVE